MPEEPPDEEITDAQEPLGDLVRRALVQAGDLRDVEDKLKILAEKSAKFTPLPGPPPDSERSG